MSGPMSVFDLTGAWLHLMDALEDRFDPETGEYREPEGIEAAFAALGEDVEAKIAGCGHVIRRMKADGNAIADEEARLRARRKRLDAGRHRLEDRVRELMILTETRTAKTASITVTLAKPAKCVEVTGPVPEQFMSRPVMPDPRPVLADIARAIKAGIAVPGAALVDGKRSLRIR